jgi:polyisoprenoid-binding protein YceI
MKSWIGPVAVTAAIIGAFAAAPAPAQTVEVDKIDKNHSTIGFSVPILGGMSEVEGKFTDFAVTLHYDQTDIARSSVQATIQVKSIDTGIPDRDTDLRGANFFDAGTYPEIRFSSSTVEKAGEQLLVRGDLVMHGKAKPVVLPVTFRVQKAEGGKMLFSIIGDLEINRDDWGIAWRHPVAGFVSNNVKIRLRILSKLITPPAPAGDKPASGS